jgi:signal transduction histidine kinase/CheY-like chemotaxis protein
VHTSDPDPFTTAFSHALGAEAAAFLLELFDELPCGALLLDAAGRVVRVNRSERLLAGRQAAEVEGRDFFRELAPHLEVEGVGPHYRTRISGVGVELEADTLLPAPAGKRVVRLTVRSHVWAGVPFGVVFLEDRTALAEEADRRQRAERLAAVGELAAGVAHEVNNPLASIKSFAQLLARDAASREQREALELIVQESSRVAGVVRNLLSFARRQGAGGRSAVSLTEIAERVLHLQRYALETAGIEVRRDFDGALSPVIGDPGALFQVVLNLVVNAEQALATWPGERLLILRTRESTEGVVLSVVDNGPGIARDQLATIFESFHTTKPEGTGLGLGISAAVVRDHAGHIGAESEEGRGAAFFIRLPRAEDDGAPRSPAAPAAAAAVGLPDRSPARRLRILVADDEPALRLAITLVLERRGHAVVAAEDAYVARRLADEGDFDVALIDARMPGDGLALIEVLESTPALRDRTVLMTGDIGRARSSKSAASGRPFLSKPFDLDEMVRLLERVAR